MDAFLLISILCFPPGLFFLWYSIRSSNPKNLETVTGKLLKANTVKNVTIGSRKYRHFTTYTYTYTVKGRQYHRKGESHEFHKRNLPRTATFIYLRGFPRFAYRNKYTGFIEQLCAALFIASGIIFVLAYYWYR